MSSNEVTESESNTRNRMEPVEATRPQPSNAVDQRGQFGRIENTVRFQKPPAPPFEQRIQPNLQRTIEQRVPNWRPPSVQQQYPSFRSPGPVFQSANPASQRPAQLQTNPNSAWGRVRGALPPRFRGELPPQMRGMNSGVEVSNKPDFQLRRGPYENESNQNMTYYREAAGPNAQRRASIVRNHVFMPKPAVMDDVGEYGRRIIEEPPTRQVINRRSSGNADYPPIGEEPRSLRASIDNVAGASYDYSSNTLNARAESAHALGENNNYRSKSVTRYAMPSNVTDGGQPPLGRHESMDAVERARTPSLENSKLFADTRNQYEPLTSGLFSAVLSPTGNNTTLKDKNSIPTKENTEKKPTPNGDIAKPPSSLPSDLRRETSVPRTPTRKAKTPDSGNSANGATTNDKKKVPMNKVTVGAAPSPNLKEVRSKIGSLENYTHKPGGGKVKIENRKLEWKVQPRIEAKNDQYAPTSGAKKIPQQKLQWNAKSKIGSLENATHKPGGGDKKIETVKLDFKDKAKSKVGSKDNIKHAPGGGAIKKKIIDAEVKNIASDIEDQKIEIKAQSKIGSLENVKHKPGGGDKKIFDDKDYLKQMANSNQEGAGTVIVTTSGSQATEVPVVCDIKTPPVTDEFSTTKVTSQPTSESTSHTVSKPASQAETLTEITPVKLLTSKHIETPTIRIMPATATSESENAPPTPPPNNAKEGVEELPKSSVVPKTVKCTTETVAEGKDVLSNQTLTQSGPSSVRDSEIVCNSQAVDKSESNPITKPNSTSASKPQDLVSTVASETKSSDVPSNDKKNEETNQQSKASVISQPSSESLTKLTSEQFKQAQTTNSEKKHTDKTEQSTDRKMDAKSESNLQSNQCPFSSVVPDAKSVPQLSSETKNESKSLEASSNLTSTKSQPEKQHTETSKTDVITATAITRELTNTSESKPEPNLQPGQNSISNLTQDAKTAPQSSNETKNESKNSEQSNRVFTDRRVEELRINATKPTLDKEIDTTRQPSNKLDLKPSSNLQSNQNSSSKLTADAKTAPEPKENKTTEVANQSCIDSQGKPPSKNGNETCVDEETDPTRQRSTKSESNPTPNLPSQQNSSTTATPDPKGAPKPSNETRHDELPKSKASFETTTKPTEPETLKNVEFSNFQTVTPSPKSDLKNNSQPASTSTPIPTANPQSKSVSEIPQENVALELKSTSPSLNEKCAKAEQKH